MKKLKVQKRCNGFLLRVFYKKKLKMKTKISAYSFVGKKFKFFDFLGKEAKFCLRKGDEFENQRKKLFKIK